MEEERILPGRDIKIDHSIEGWQDQIGIREVICPFCWEKVRSDEDIEGRPKTKCKHFYRITGGCGVSAAFFFYEPPRRERYGN